MPSKEELLKLVAEHGFKRRAYLDALSLSELKKVKEQLKAILDDLGHLQEGTGSMLSSADYIIERREAHLENQKRKARRKKSMKSLRTFLGEPPLGNDEPLETLPLCAKSGATVLLEGLSFGNGKDQVTVRTVNDAKKLFVEGRECWAGWHLHYVKDGQVSAGFGWERPFLDEVFLMRDS